MDTSFWVALHMRRDRWHQEARQLISRVKGPLMTTNHVRGEAWTVIRRRDSHRMAIACLEGIDQSPRVDVVHLERELEVDALAWLTQHDERVYSFVDATSFAFMRMEGIREALAFDADFSAAGFEELRV